MKPLGFALDRMSAAMRDVEALREPGDSDRHAQARQRLSGVRAEAVERREGLERQLAMADEFIELLGNQLE